MFNSNVLLDLGDLQCVDGYMNIALEQTEEYVEGELKNKYGDVFVRGNNGTFGNARFVVPMTDSFL